MKRLILLRHAKAERRSASGADIDRALTEEGRGAAASVGHALAAAGLIPDLALISPTLRTRQTFEALGVNLPDVTLQITPALYDAPAAVLRGAAESAEGDTILVVAHNPGVGALALALVQACIAAGVEERSALEQGFPTATAAAFEFVHGRTACLGVFRPAAV
ncbi:histidine phosphatase family protein [Caulobacter sp. S45]|uniref:SixA phosphatase family protein n=1 Tax=Caulobacter sp. S45 TaxID=1641861 RepID=UPI0015750498|nr:histidine phosphatase family protein [Caulobacter sp. S45]